MVKGEATLGGRRTTPVIFVAYLQQLGHVLLVLPCWKMMPYSFCRDMLLPTLGRERQCGVEFTPICTWKQDNMML